MNVELYWQIHQLAFLLEKRADDALKNQTNIGFAQYKVLEAVGRNILAKQNIIAELLNQTEASISRQVKILEKKGLLTIGTVMNNRRARELALTEQGEECLRHSEELLDMVQSQIFGTLHFEEQQLLQALFERMLSKS
jgi:DNA-binding MarR family transcriptional regulator